MLQEQRIPVVIKAIRTESPKVKRITFTSFNGSSLPVFSAGAHIKTFIKHKESTLERYYSLTNHPEDTRTYEIAVRISDESNGGSSYWHHTAREGEVIEIGYPKNHFPLSFKAKHHVFYGAGIGITPFLSMMVDLIKSRGGSFELHYAARNKEMCPFYSFIKKQYQKQCHFYFSEEGNRLQKETLLEHRIGTHVYFCGPHTFIHDFTNAAKKYGYPQTSIHSELFTPPKPQKAAGFQVTLRDSGRSVLVEKEESLLDVLLSLGLNVPYSCKIGRCGTCELNVLEGKVEHYDHFLSEEQQASHKIILSCVSRAKGEKLVLDC
ncbi:PDR/VanB family oxidoreductase [Sutcliffiella halmapala]|uniref:PDR/VanB family oxidoreductase n=1 Tax=Sutcliffiella halmapala TaxID=79882 RepID=UPI001F27154E|nr:ferredoxin reductase [Sutcliffiella halmapala]